MSTENTVLLLQIIIVCYIILLIHIYKIDFIMIRHLLQ